MEEFCMQCPRRCGVTRREDSTGYCGVPREFLIARAALHPWEEPSISGTRGSGTVFFSGCNLRCVYCQNREISHLTLGEKMSADRLRQKILQLRDAGAHNINFVTPTHYAHQLADLLQELKPELGIPVVYNCGGYESVETLKRLDGLVDVYLPDLKYYSPVLSARYSDAENYFAIAKEALREMLRQTGAPQIDGDGLLVRGTVVRHLVLPAAKADSIALLRALASEFGTRAFYLSLMSQYTPDFAKDCPHRELHRRVTTFEYEAVLQEAVTLGFEGYFQSRHSATSAFTPDFRESVEALRKEK